MGDRGPNLLLAGVGKAGSTSLYRWLAAHDEVDGGRVKEPRWFAWTWQGGQPTAWEEYTANWQRDDVGWRLDGSVDTYLGGRAAATAVRRHLGRPKVVLLLRDPVERLASAHRFFASRAGVRGGVSLREMAEIALQQRASDPDRRMRKFYWALTGSLYGELVPPFLDEFGEDCFVAATEDMARSRARLGEWLGLHGPPRGLVDLDANRSMGFRSAPVHRVAVTVRDRGATLLERWPRLRVGLRRAYARVNSAPVEVDQQEPLPDEVHELIAASNERLRAALRASGHDIPSWLC